MMRLGVYLIIFTAALATAWALPVSPWTAVAMFFLGFLVGILMALPALERRIAQVARLETRRIAQVARLETELYILEHRLAIERMLRQQRSEDTRPPWQDLDSDTREPWEKPADWWKRPGGEEGRP